MRLLIINSSPDTCDMLEAFFQREGWTTIVAPARELREHRVSGRDLMAEHRPDVILMDVAIPYDSNWRASQELRADPAVVVPIVVTTTNEAALRSLVGPDERIQEIVGKPYDLYQLHEAVLAAISGIDAPRALPKVERRLGDRRLRDRRQP
jgi:DNA-binding response OmpR family regulator